MIIIEWIKKKIQSENYYFSKHGDTERQNDNLSILEIKEAILNGIILDKFINPYGFCQIRHEKNEKRWFDLY